MDLTQKTIEKLKVKTGDKLFKTEKAGVIKRRWIKKNEMKRRITIMKANCEKVNLMEKKAQRNKRNRKIMRRRIVNRNGEKGK